MRVAVLAAAPMAGHHWGGGSSKLHPKACGFSAAAATCALLGGPPPPLPPTTQASGYYNVLRSRRGSDGDGDGDGDGGGGGGGGEGGGGLPFRAMVLRNGATGWSKWPSCRGHSRPPRARQAASEGVGPLFAVVRKRPAPKTTLNYRGHLGARPRPRRHSHRVCPHTSTGAQLSLGRFASAEEAALCYARSPEGRAAHAAHAHHAHAAHARAGGGGGVLGAWRRGSGGGGGVGGGDEGAPPPPPPPSGGLRHVDVDVDEEVTSVC